MRVGQLFLFLISAMSITLRAQGATVTECKLETMRPYVRSGLREVAAETLYENKIETYPNAVNVSFKGSVTSKDLGATQDAFEIHLTTKAGRAIRVYSSDQLDQKWLTISAPKIEDHLDSSGNFIGHKCVAYLNTLDQRYFNFESEVDGALVYQYKLPEEPVMLAWVAITANRASTPLH
jgi:hypothetical protein